MQTDDYIDDFTKQGYSHEEAEILAFDYLQSHAAFANSDNFMTPTDFAVNFDLTAFDPGEDIGIINYDDDNTPEFGKGFSIGCDFKGIKVIKERETDRMFIPDSYYCLVKCYNKFFELTGTTFKLTTHDLSPYGSSMTKVKDNLKAMIKKCNCPRNHSKLCNKMVCKCKKTCTPECRAEIKTIMNNLPKYYRYTVKKGKMRLLAVNDKHIPPHPYSILLVPFGGSEYHAILAKIPANQITKEDARLEFGRDIKLECEFQRLKGVTIKSPIPFIYCYDIETYTTYPTPGKQALVPYALAYNRVDLAAKSWTEPVMISMSGRDENFNIFDEMVKQITEKENQSFLDNKHYEIQIYAHNGGGFDNIFAKSMKTVKFLTTIAKGSKIKSMTLELNERKMVFKDSLPFTLSSLAVAGKMFGAKERKMDGFDIVGKSKEWYDSEQSWIPYLNQDVVALASLMISVEEYMMKFGESVTYNIGLPSVTWRVLNKTCYGMKDQYVPKSPSVIELIKQSNIGGRVLHWKKEIDTEKGDEEYICYDANSLYPSAMYSSSFPYGQPQLIEDFSSFEDGSWTEKFKHCIVTATILPSNTRYPFHPYRDDKGNILYPVYEFTGTYNDVDLKEMLKDGYRIIKVTNGIYWTKSARIFSDLIYTLYQMRRDVGGDSPMGYFLKIFLNSMYGKLFEKIDSKSMFTKDRTEIERAGSRARLLPSGYYEISQKLQHTMVRKPLQLASYVLANSRKLMNELIRNVGPENIAYGDTDSLYISKKAAVKVAAFSNTDLCGFKNDYGEGLWVKKAIFLDIKRYYLKFNKPDEKGCDVKMKFNGLNFRDKERIANYKQIKDFKLAAAAIYEDLKYQNNGETISVVQEKFERCGLQIIICEKDLKFQVSTSKRAKWEGNEFYPLGYNKDAPEYKITPTDPIGNHVKTMFEHKSLDYSLRRDYASGRITLESCLPLRRANDNRIKVQSQMTEEEAEKRKEQRKLLTTEIKASAGMTYCDYLKTSYVKHGNKLYYCMDTSIRTEKGVRLIKEYFDLCPLGPFKKTEDVIDSTKIEHVVYVKEYSGPAAQMDNEDYQLLQQYKRQSASRAAAKKNIANAKTAVKEIPEAVLVEI